MNASLLRFYSIATLYKYIAKFYIFLFLNTTQISHIWRDCDLYLTLWRMSKQTTRYSRRVFTKRTGEKASNAAYAVTDIDVINVGHFSRSGRVSVRIYVKAKFP